MDNEPNLNEVTKGFRKMKTLNITLALLLSSALIGCGGAGTSEPLKVELEVSVVQVEPAPVVVDESQCGTKEEVKAANYSGSAPRIYLSFDDYSENWRHIISEYKCDPVEFTFFVTAGGKLVEDLAADGHSIGNHTRTHLNLATQASGDDWLDILDAEILSLNDELIEASGQSEIKAFAYPFGSFTQAWESELLSHFWQVRRFGTPNNKPQVYDASDFSQIRIIASSSLDNGVHITDESFYGRVDDMLDELVLANGVVSVTVHDISENEYAITRPRLDYLITESLKRGVMFKGF